MNPAADVATIDYSLKGHRILEAMHEARNYTNAIFSAARSALPSASHRVMDFGAGDGLLAKLFADAGMNPCCIEPDPELLVHLRNAGHEVQTETRALETSTFDFIYTVNVLEHISDLHTTIGELNRVLRPGGKLLVFVPAFEVLWTSMDDEVGHYRRFTRTSLRMALTAAGFQVDSTRYFDSLGFAAALAIKGFERFKPFEYNKGTVGFYDRFLFPVSRAMDFALSGLIGKNVIAVASKPQ